MVLVRCLLVSCPVVPWVSWQLCYGHYQARLLPKQGWNRGTEYSEGYSVQYIILRTVYRVQCTGYSEGYSVQYSVQSTVKGTVYDTVHILK